MSRTCDELRTIRGDLNEQIRKCRAAGSPAPELALLHRVVVVEMRECGCLTDQEARSERRRRYRGLSAVVGPRSANRNTNDAARVSDETRAVEVGR